MTWSSDHAPKPTSCQRCSLSSLSVTSDVCGLCVAALRCSNFARAALVCSGRGSSGCGDRSCSGHARRGDVRGGCARVVAGGDLNDGRLRSRRVDFRLVLPRPTLSDFQESWNHDKRTREHAAEHETDSNLQRRATANHGDEDRQLGEQDREENRGARDHREPHASRGHDRCGRRSGSRSGFG